MKVVQNKLSLIDFRAAELCWSRQHYRSWILGKSENPHMTVAEVKKWSKLKWPSFFVAVACGKKVELTHFAQLHISCTCHETLCRCLCYFSHPPVWNWLAEMAAPSRRCRLVIHRLPRREMMLVADLRTVELRPRWSLPGVPECGGLMARQVIDSLVFKLVHKGSGCAGSLLMSLFGLTGLTGETPETMSPMLTEKYPFIHFKHLRFVQWWGQFCIYLRKMS